MARNSKIILAKNILIDRAHKNVLNYSTNSMLSLLRSSGHLVAEAANYSFIQNGIISTGFTYTQALTSNYIAFQNPNYTEKWFFAFIDRVEYESEKSTKIYYTIDTWATWFDNLSFKPCYVIREHVSNDAIGANTIEEGLAVQDFVCELSETDVGLGSMFYVGVLSNYNPTTNTSFSGIAIHNRGIFGSDLCLFPFTTSLYNAVDLEAFILQTNNKGHIAEIQDIFIIPYSLIPAANLLANTFNVDGVSEDYTFYTLDSFSFDDYEYDWQVNKTTTFSDYTPKNNKCFCYPYNYLYVTNNSGDSEIFKYENFSNTTKATFKVQLALSIGCSGRIVPTNYKNVSEYLDGSVSLGKYPTCQWSSDSYINWLTQNAVNNTGSFIKAGLAVVGAAISGGATIAAGATISAAGALSTVGNLSSNVGGMIGGFYQAQLLPNRVTGTNTGDVNYASDDITFKLEHMRIKTEYLKEIDDYFTRFGYKVIRVKTPNITGRTNFNYIEIGQGERFAYGEVPSEALNEINIIAQNGVTIWHNHSNVGNYNVTNTITT